MATVPLSGTNIKFLSGVPFSNDYKNTRWFDTLTSQQTYFNARTVVHSMTQANFQRIEGYSFIAADLSIDDLWGTNYIMFQNTSYNSKWFYAFVTKLEYVQRNRTNVYFEIDVLQTWKFEMNFKPSYVVREHCPLYNIDGTPVINSIDEGLNYGTDYDTVSATNYNAVEDVDGIPVFFLVIVAKGALHVPAGGAAKDVVSSLNGLPQPLCYYVIPFYLGGYQLSANGTLLPDITDTLEEIATNDSTVNNIVSMYVTEHIGASVTVTGGVNTGSPNVSFPVGFDVVDMSGTSATLMYGVFVENSPTYDYDTLTCGNVYDDFGTPTESKLLMYPYSVIILDDFKGNRVVLKPQYFDQSLPIFIQVLGSISPTNKMAYAPRNYDIGPNVTDSFITKHVALENGLINSDPQDIPIVTDQLATFLQGNKNTINNQMNSIIFNGAMNGIGSIVGGVASAATGNAAGVASSAVGLVQGAGNTVLSIQGIQAKQKDIDNLPPQLSKMGNSAAFSYGNEYYGFYLIKKQIKPEYQTKLSDFFNMFGYKVNEVKTPNFHTRANWNYVQTKSCNITGDFNHEDLQDLKNIFDNGITLWHTDDVGNYSLSNGVI